MQKLQLPKGSFHLVLVWPLGCFLLGLLLWGVTFSKLHNEKIALEEQALKDAYSLASAYAQQLTRATEQADQITVQVKHDWSKSNGMLKLEELVQAGLFPSTRLLLVHIADRNGRIVSATIPLNKPIIVTDRDYFVHHQQDKSAVLRVGLPTTGRASEKVIVQFTRRLNRANGSFDGVVIVSAEIPYFLSFYERASLGANGLLATVGTDGLLRASSIGRAVSASMSPALKAIPEFGSTEGARLMDGVPWFADNQSRFVGWSTVKGYPLIAMVGLSEDEVLAPQRQTWITYRNYAIAGSISLFLFALFTTMQALRLARTKRESRKAREMYGVATEGGAEGYYMWRALHDKSGTVADFQIVDCNERAADVYGLNKAQLLGRTLSSFYERAFFDKTMITYRHAMEEGLYEDEYRVPPESPLKMEWLHRKMVRTKLGLALTLRDISEAKAYEHELLRRANHDELTGLPNRQWLRDFLPAALERVKRTDTMLAVLFVDLDGFKLVNDTLGHSAGDELLRAAAVRLKSVLRPTDNVARFGGDEFIVILEPIVQKTKPAFVAERIAETFRQPFSLTVS